LSGFAGSISEGGGGSDPISTDGLTDAQLRATPVPVSETVTTAEQTLGDVYEYGACSADWLSTWLYIPKTVSYTTFDIFLGNADSVGVIKILGTNRTELPFSPHVLEFTQTSGTVVSGGYPVSSATDVSETFVVPRRYRYLRVWWDRTSGGAADTIHVAVEHSY
jgi:hypothetical protein